MMLKSIYAGNFHLIFIVTHFYSIDVVKSYILCGDVYKSVFFLRWKVGVVFTIFRYLGIYKAVDTFGERLLSLKCLQY
jgi:hypothetical protein